MLGPYIRAGKPDDLGFPPLAFPLNDGLAALGAPDQECVDGHSDGKLAERDVHLAGDDFIFRNFPHPKGQAGRHLRKLPRRFGIGQNAGFLICVNNIAGRSSRFSSVPE